jgi:4-hydroxybenzoyl-CoA thioesterase/acyl-CoA thioester hydrolase
MHEFRVQRRVEFADTDMGGVCHFARYFVFMENAEHEFIASLGGSVASAGPKRDIYWPRVSASCDFKSSARFRDLLDIRLRVRRKGETSLAYEVTFRRDGEVIAIGRLVTVCCSRDPSGKFAPVPIPSELAEKISQAPD